MHFDISDDFLEVKIDPSSLKEDDLFPASMFEPHNGFQANKFAIETDAKSQISQPKGEFSQANNNVETIVLDDDSAENSSESHGQSHDRKMEDCEPNINGILSKDDSADLNKLKNDEHRTVDNEIETQNESVDLKQVQSDNTGEAPDVLGKGGSFEAGERLSSPDLIERQGSVSSVTSLPDVVENSDAQTTQEIAGSPDTSRVVPDLVKDYQNLDFVSDNFFKTLFCCSEGKFRHVYQNFILSHICEFVAL